MSTIITRKREVAANEAATFSLYIAGISIRRLPIICAIDTAETPISRNAVYL
jgi:hypothetical protein